MFSKDRPDPLTEAIKDASVSPDCFGKLFEILDPVLHNIARKIASQCVDDAVQVARIRIWRKLQKVDLSRPATAKAYLLKTGVSAMRDEVRKYLRMTPANLHSLEKLDVEDHSIVAAVEGFEGVLALYEAYIEETGDFAGAHRGVADVLGVTTARASTLFHAASKAYIDMLAAELKKEVKCLDG